MKASDLFVQCLETEGIEYIFGVPGEENADFMMSLEQSERIRFILCRHEQGAAFMAEVYGRLTGNPAGYFQRRRPPPGIPRPVRLGRRTEHRRERRLRLTQRDPALTQSAGLHDATPCHRRRPPGSAWVARGVLQSANLWA